MLPVCSICFTETPLIIQFRCESYISHYCCCYCARSMIRNALEQKNFCGSVRTSILQFGIPCPMCRTYVVHSPFKMLPSEMYSSSANFVCNECTFHTCHSEQFVRHVVYECPANTFKCKSCSCDIHWDTLNLDRLVDRHIRSNECVGVRCGYGTCKFRGTYNRALEHYKSHQPRRWLIEKFKNLVSQSSVECLARVACLSDDFLRCIAATDSQMAEYEKRVLNDVYREISEEGDDEESDSEDDDDDEVRVSRVILLS